MFRFYFSNEISMGGGFFFHLFRLTHVGSGFLAIFGFWSYMNTIGFKMFSFFENPVQALVKRVQHLSLRAAKYVQPACYPVQVFGEKLNMLKRDLYSFFPEKLNMLKLDMFRLGHPIVKKRDAG